ncbi:hypothetical protein JCM10212_003920 [Sporobolomyces blumeae]
METPAARLTAAAAPLSSLTEANLRSHTSTNGPQARRTIESYLASISQVHGQFDHSEPPPAFDNTDSTHSTFAPLAGPSSAPLVQDRKRPRDDVTRRDAEEETALVIHDQGRQGESGMRGLLKSGDRNKLDGKKRPTLVSALRPRLASIAVNDEATPSGDKKPSARRHAAQQKEAAGTERLSLGGDKENRRSRGDPGAQDERGLKKRAEKEAALLDASKERVAPKKIKGKGRLREEVENEEEVAELEERLDGRKERRRQKALVRRDTTRSAAATGVAAAANLRKGRRKRDEDDSDESGGGDDLKRTKRGRRAAETDGRERVNALERPRLIGPGRLTVKPPRNLGIFNKGKASARTAVGRPVPDLAFSEMNFLNSTRPPPPASSSSSTSVSEEEIELAKVDQREKMKKTARPDGVKTYGIRSKNRRRSVASIPLSLSPAAEHARLRSSASPKKGEKAGKARTIEHGTNEANRNKGKTRSRPRLVFSHVAAPSRQSSSSLSSLVPTTSYAKPSRDPEPSLLRSGSAGETDALSEPSARSAHSLAMRRLARQRCNQTSPRPNSRQSFFVDVPAVPRSRPATPALVDAVPKPDQRVMPEASANETLAGHSTGKGGGVAPVGVAPIEASGLTEPHTTSIPSIDTASIARLLPEVESRPSNPPTEIATGHSNIEDVLGPATNGRGFSDEIVFRDLASSLARSRASSETPSFQHRPEFVFTRRRSWSDAESRPFLFVPTGIPTSSVVDVPLSTRRTLPVLVPSQDQCTLLVPSREQADLTADVARDEIPTAARLVRAGGRDGLQHALTNLDDDDAFRQAMRRQWPKTTL